MAAPVPLDWPQTQERDVYFSTRPVTGPALAGLSNLLNGLAGSRFRRCGYSQFEQSYQGLSALGYTGDPPPPDAIAQNQRMLIDPSENALHLFVALEYVAVNNSTNPPQIVASLYDMAGAVQDVGVIWQLADGTLPAENRALVNGVAIVAYKIGVQRMVSTGVRVDDSLATGPGPSQPRLLYAATVAGTVCDLRFATTDARILAASVWEWPEATI